MYGGTCTVTVCLLVVALRNHIHWSSPDTYALGAGVKEMALKRSKQKGVAPEGMTPGCTCGCGELWLNMCFPTSGNSVHLRGIYVSSFQSGEKILKFHWPSFKV